MVVSDSFSALMEEVKQKISMLEDQSDPDIDPKDDVDIKILKV